MLSAEDQQGVTGDEGIRFTMFALNKAHECTEAVLRCLWDDPCTIPDCLDGVCHESIVRVFRIGLSLTSIHDDRIYAANWTDRELAEECWVGLRCDESAQEAHLGYLRLADVVCTHETPSVVRSNCILPSISVRHSRWRKLAYCEGARCDEKVSEDNTFDLARCMEEAEQRQDDLGYLRGRGEVVEHARDSQYDLCYSASVWCRLVPDK